MLRYKVVELSTVTDEAIEGPLNSLTPQGWRLESLHFAMRDSSKRPSMAFSSLRARSRKRKPPKEATVTEGYVCMEAETAPFQKAEALERFLAKFIDLLIAGAFFAFPTFVGPLAAMTYILISDGIRGGQSLGKRVIGLRTVLAETGEPCDFKRSIVRNSPFALLIVFGFLVGWIPYLGKLLFLVAALAVGAFELVLVYTDERGARFGDRVAGTVVVPSKR